MGIFKFLKRFFTGPEIPLQTLFDNEILRDCLSCCPEGTELIINHNNAECWVDFDRKIKKGESDNLGFTKVILNRDNLALLFKHIKNDPFCVKRSNGFSIEGNDGKLLFQANTGFSIDFISDALPLSYAGHTGAKLVSAFGYRYVGRQNAQDPIWLINELDPEKKNETLLVFFKSVFREFDRVYLCTELEPDELPGDWVETKDFSWKIPHGDYSKLASWLEDDEWVIYSSKDPEEMNFIESIINAEPAQALQLMEQGDIDFLIEGKPMLKHYRIIRG